MLKYLILYCLAMASTMAFVPVANCRPATTSLSAALMSPPPPPTSNIVMDTASITTSSSSALTQGVDSYMKDGPSSQLVALQERKIPTKEEIAAKKRNFNLWLWGGGFVAPFLATFYYFGFKFWEK
jgi:hypothetical protein